MIGTFVMVYHRDGSVFRCSTDHEGMLREAFERYLGQAPSWKRDCDTEGDEILSFTLIGGNKYHCLISSIYSYLISTPEGRRASAELEAELNSEPQQISTPTSALVAVPQ